MALTRTQVVLKTADGLPENFITNTWHSVDAGPQGRIDFSNALVTFYRSIGDNFSNLLALTGHLFKQYDLLDPLPRAPVFEGTFNFLSAFPGSPLPQEVALCLSFQGEKISGVPQARRRGRVFLGPFTAAVMGTGGRPSATLLTDVRTAADVLLEASLTSTAWAWAVFSPTTGGAVPGGDLASVTDVTNGWIDDAFDTQRRRGVAPSSRQSFPIP